METIIAFKWPLISQNMAALHVVHDTILKDIWGKWNYDLSNEFNILVAGTGKDCSWRGINKRRQDSWTSATEYDFSILYKFYHSIQTDTSKVELMTQ